MSKKNNIARYYSRVGSWLVYNLVMGRSQHAGYWKDDTRTEKEAQGNYLVELDKILQVKNGMRVLDAGSGQGYIARYLADQHEAEITGITITPREVRVSEGLSRNMKNKPKFVLGDYSKMSFPDNYFDIVYTTETLSHAVSVNNAIGEFYRVLKPGGRLTLFDYEVNTNAKSKNIEDSGIYQLLIDYAGGFGLNQQNPGEISECLRSAGLFEVEEIDWTKYTMPTYERLRRIASPLRWIKPKSVMAKYFVNTVMANYGYVSMHEAGAFRYLVYRGIKPVGGKLE